MWLTGWLGIIPARAGFTETRCCRRWPLTDHPRSRGVYSPSRTGRLPVTGSSPLARGLPAAPDHADMTVRIIPARAGFTTTPPRTRLGTRDHPRSRGVYVALGAFLASFAGSSPLARGLLGNFDVIVASTGIIPARAGFTSQQGYSAARFSDHPRSRGVYLRSPTILKWSEGSSPLARGLRNCPTTTVVVGWIIPARAGFTFSYRSRTGMVSDHPRSRGVYLSVRGTCATQCGSSPLARGLHVAALDIAATERIIPARAGFTAGGSGRLLDHQDHPRSRGVYPCTRL